MTVFNTETKVDRKTLVIMGLIAIILGLLAMLAPIVTGLSVAFLLGAIVAVAGLVRMFWAFKTHGFGRGLILSSIGGLTLLAGIAIMLHPKVASGILTIVLTLYFILDGICEIAAAQLLKPNKGWVWMTIVGVISISLGFMIWSQFPLAGAWAVGVLLGVKLLLIGSIVMFSTTHISLHGHKA